MTIILSIISILIILLNVFFIKNTFFGFFGLLIWVVIVGWAYKKVLEKYFKNLFCKKLLGCFIAFYFLCFFGSIFILFYKINLLFFAISLVCATIFPWIFINKKELISFKRIFLIKEYYLKIKNKYHLRFLNKRRVNVNFLILFISFISIAILIMYYLLKARNGEYNIYQFNNTNPLLWLLFASLIVLDFIFIFKFENNIKKYFSFGIILVILTSFLFHSPLVTVYKSGFGGDRLRHTGAEKFLQEGNIYTPSLFGSEENVSMKEFAGIKIPEVLVVGNKQSYSNKWASDIFLSWILNIDVINIDKYFVFIIWSIFIPIIFINIFKNFSKDNKTKLIFALSSVFLSPFLIQGSQGDPRGFGLLLFLFVLMLFIEKVNNDDFNIKTFFIFLFSNFILLYFNYILFLGIFFIISSLYVVFKTNIKNKSLSVIIFSLPILLLDLLSLQTFLIKQSFLELLERIKDFFLNLLSIKSTYIEATESAKNFLYFRTATDIPFINMPWIVNLAFIFTSIFWIISVIGIVKFYKKEEKNRFIIFSFLSLLISYTLSEIAFDGVRIFAKRTEIIIALFLLIFFCYAIVEMINKQENNTRFVIATSFCALLAVSTLSSGPIMENATESDFKAAKWVFEQVKNDEKKCVIGNTWPLLALEYESGRQIITGGFPEGFEYSQKERVEIFNAMITNPTKDVLEKAKEITGANKCYFMIRNKYITDIYSDVNVYDKYNDILKVFRANKDIDDVKIFEE